MPTNGPLWLDRTWKKNFELRGTRNGGWEPNQCDKGLGASFSSACDKGKKQPSADLENDLCMISESRSDLRALDERRVPDLTFALTSPLSSNQETLLSKPSCMLKLDYEGLLQPPAKSVILLVARKQPPPIYRHPAPRFPLELACRLGRSCSRNRAGVARHNGCGYGFFPVEPFARHRLNAMTSKRQHPRQGLRDTCGYRRAS